MNLLRNWRPLAAIVAASILAGCASPAPTTPEPGPTESVVPETTAAPPPTSEPVASEPPVVEPAPRPPTVHVLVVSTGFYPANPQFELNVSVVPANASIVLTYRDRDLNPLGKHDWTLEGVQGAQTPQVETGKEATIEFVAPSKPGAYVYYCAVPQHRDFGMEGTLTVREA